MAFSNILPDPVNKITDAGVYDNSTGTAGPGFASLNMRSVRDTQVSRTISGRGITRSQGSQNWEVDITYNPMTRDQFEPVYSFLLSRNARRSPFYVALPQYSSSRSGAWGTTALYSLYVKNSEPAGNSTLLVRHFNLTGAPKPGDMFTITDVNDTNHTKAYRITRVETSTVYDTAVTDSKEVRIHFVPPLVRSVTSGIPAANITTTSVDSSTNTFTLAAHGLVAGQEIVFRSGNTTDLVVGRGYYVVSGGFTSGAFRISQTFGGSELDITVTTNCVFSVMGITGASTAATDIVTVAAHGLATGQEVRVTVTATNAVADQTYYAINATSSTFKFAVTYAHALANTPVIDLTNTNSPVVVPSPTKLVFIDPKIRCILKNDVQEYSLSTNNLYQFGLNLEEIQP